MREPAGKDVRIDGVGIHFHDVGEGPVVVMLHGGGPGASGWSNFSQNVETLSKHFRLLLIDQPGYGRSEKTLPPDGEARSVFGGRLVLGLLEQLGVERAHIIGNSLGGRTALVMALKAPEKIDKLLLMGPGGGSLSIFSPEPSEGMKVLKDFYAAPGPSLERMEALVRVMMFDPSRAPKGLAQARLDAALAPDVREFFQHFFSAPGAREPELWRDLEKVTHKTLIVWGRDDRVMPYESGLIMLKRMPDARLHILPRCGHWAQLEQQAEFERLALDFFRN